MRIGMLGMKCCADREVGIVALYQASWRGVLLAGAKTIAFLIPRFGNEILLAVAKTCPLYRTLRLVDFKTFMQRRHARSKRLDWLT
jgi:hypothetical protein